MSKPHEEAAEISRGIITKYGPAAGERGPEQFVRDMWGATPDPGQIEMLRAYGRGERGISVRSAVGVGKTTGLSWIAIIHMMTRFPQKTLITAPSAGQLFDALYAEVVQWIGMLPIVLQDLFSITATRIEYRPAPKSSFMSFRTARAENPEALQGVHSLHDLLIADEASAVPDPIFAAAAGIMSGEHAQTILTSNPTRTTGFFYKTQTDPDMADRWYRIHISGIESPRQTDAYRQEIILSYGEDHNEYRIRVLGEFPTGDLNTVIPRALVTAAIDRNVRATLQDIEIWGLDVARFGNDSTVLCKRRGREVSDLLRWEGMDTMQTAGRVRAEFRDTPVDYRPELILVDDIGVGGGVTDRLRELNLPVMGINTSESPSQEGRYNNLRSELWFEGLKWLQEREGGLPSPQESHAAKMLADELCIPTYTYLSNGALKVESKLEMRRRGEKSPNHADAFLLTLAAPASVMIHGRRYKHGEKLDFTLSRTV